MLETYEDVEKFLDSNGQKLYDNTPRYSIQFGLAENNKATLHILEDGLVITVINCFTWAQTRDIRAYFVFGDNHRSRKRNWLNVCMVIRDTIHSLELYAPEKVRRVV